MERIVLQSGHASARQVGRIVECLAGGGVIAYPTDTTYGLGCSIMSRNGLERIYRMKRRDAKKPFSFICPDISGVSKYARVSTFAFRILKRRLPGPYTFVLEAARQVPDMLVTRQKTVGIRIPDSRVCLAIVAELGFPLVTTSANLSGEEPVGDPESIIETFGHQLDMILDGGMLPTCVSSVISLIGDRTEILREGAGDISWCGTTA